MIEVESIMRPLDRGRGESIQSEALNDVGDYRRLSSAGTADKSEQGGQAPVYRIQEISPLAAPQKKGRQTTPL